MIAFHDLDTWARTVMGEARGEEFEGQVAVAWVIRNRVETDLGHDGKPDWWGEDYSGVCLKPQQFSCWNDSDPNKPLILAATLAQREYQRALGVCLLVYVGDLPDPTNGATSYHAKSVKPAWAKALEETTEIGHHVFYRERA